MDVVCKVKCVLYLFSFPTSVTKDQENRGEEGRTRKKKGKQATNEFSQKRAKK